MCRWFDNTETALRMKFVSPLGAAEDAEESVVEVGPGLEQESSLNGPAGDGDEGVEVGYAAKFSGHTL